LIYISRTDDHIKTITNGLQRVNILIVFDKSK